MKKPLPISEIVKRQPTDLDRQLRSYADSNKPTPKTLHLYQLMADLFGGKWEREHGIAGDDKFYVWADKIEDMPKEQLRRRFDAMEHKFKKDVSEGKDIWPPSLAYFMALNGNPRVNEQAYRQHVPALREYTVDEYAEIAERKAKEIKERLGYENTRIFNRNV